MLFVELCFRGVFCVYVHRFERRDLCLFFDRSENAVSYVTMAAKRSHSPSNRSFRHLSVSSTLFTNQPASEDFTQFLVDVSAAAHPPLVHSISYGEVESTDITDADRFNTVAQVWRTCVFVCFCVFLRVF